MKNFSKSLVATCVAATLPALALAEPYRVEMRGVVDFNVIAGNMGPVPDGAPVAMAFNVDSTNFLNSATFPTRGYAIDLPSFSMTVGGVPVNMVIPQPAGAYFVLRNNDPQVDGFFISSGTDVPFPLSVRIPGLNPLHDLDFLATYTSNTTLGSLNIADAVGTYNLTGLSVYNWTIGRFGNPGASYAYQSLTISAVPEPAALSLLGLGLLVVLGRATAARKTPASREAIR